MACTPKKKTLSEQLEAYRAVAPVPKEVTIQVRSTVESTYEKAEIEHDVGEPPDCDDTDDCTCSGCRDACDCEHPSQEDCNGECTCGCSVCERLRDDHDSDCDCEGCTERREGRDDSDEGPEEVTIQVRSTADKRDEYDHGTYWSQVKLTLDTLETAKRYAKQAAEKIAIMQRRWREERDQLIGKRDQLTDDECNRLANLDLLLDSPVLDDAEIYEIQAAITEVKDRYEDATAVKFEAVKA